MLSPETLESYRRMTPGERLRLTFELQKSNERFLLMGTPEQVLRKFELLNKQNDERNVAMLTAIAESEKRLRNDVAKMAP
jgi:Asp-tRNA(Asn)/Glu-tRNA(Gln) amidotransferase C subunit